MWWEFNIVAWFYTFRDKNLVSRVAFKLKNVGALILCSFLRKCKKEVIWDIKVPAKRHLQQINFCHEGCLTSWKVYLIFTLKKHSKYCFMIHCKIDIKYHSAVTLLDFRNLILLWVTRRICIIWVKILPTTIFNKQKLKSHLNPLQSFYFSE